jgi:hypothetical protein
MTNVKYPKTWHLPYSRHIDNSDRVLSSTAHFENKRVIVTAKLDGECSGITNKVYHARSLYSRDHVSRHWVKNLHAQIKYLIPDGYKIFGENLFAQHSIHYTNLKSYFFAFNILHDDTFLSWDDFLEWCKKLNLEVVPVLYEGIWNEEKIRSLYTLTYDGNELEGYVVRVRDAFLFSDFNKNVAKFVRKNHVSDNKDFWMERIVPNELAKKRIANMTKQKWLELTESQRNKVCWYQLEQK